MNRTEQYLKIFLVLFLLVTLPAIVISSQHRVPQQYRTIQSAINTSKAGDTVLVEHGIYFENIVINKNITLASRFIVDQDASHISNTIIDGSKPLDSLKASCIYIYGKTDSNCVIIGFTIRRGLGTFVHAPIEEGIDPTVLGVTEDWIGGGGIFMNNAGARIAYNVITENKLSTRIKNNFTYGAGIAANDSTFGKHLPSPFVIEHNTVCDNISSGIYAEGAGINVWQPGIIRHNTIIRNKTFSSTRSTGGGVAMGVIGNYDLIADGNYICNNTAGIGGGMLITTGTFRRGRSIVTNNIIANNKAFEVGGAANIAEGAYTLFVNNTIVGNKAMASGGGLNVTVGSHATLVNNIIWRNETEQISMWGDVQAITNDIEGGFPGRNNIHDDPKFLFDDSLFQLLPNSPCLGTGTDSIRIFQHQFPIPDYDFAGHRRPFPHKTSRDIGARESSFELPSISTDILLERISTLDSRVKLTMIIKQSALGERDVMTSEITRAGKMIATLIVNDTLQSIVDPEISMPQFTLPPGDNLIELEIIGKGINKPKGINVFFWLEGFDPHVSRLRKNIGVAFNYYANLKPGKYKLIFQPQDQENIIGHTNRVAVEIIVPPYWYQQWWAYGVYAIVVIGIAYGFYRVQVNRLQLKQTVLKEHLNTEKAEELSKLKSRFLANVSHEFRTPLSLILGPIEFLLSKKNDPECVEQLSIVQRNAQRLMRLIELLLQFSRAESGTIKLAVAHEDVVPILRRFTGYFSSPAAKKQIEIKFVPEQEHIAGLIDKEKIEHIVQNCISNAVKFTLPGGAVNVRVRVENNDMIISVNDTGVGIAPEHLSHIFDRFYRVDTMHKTEGTGIGLSLSKELAEIHHGSIRIESALGKGTTVTVRIPLSGYSDSEKVALSPEISAIQESKHDYSDSKQTVVDDKEQPIILIAEDNEDARLFIRTQLARQYTIIEVEDGMDALNKTKFQIPDLVISDVMMPRKNGLELCKELKEDERTSHIPIILLTALADREDKLKGLTTGADDYLVKPFDAQELLTRVKNLLDNRKKIRQAYGKTVELKPGEVFVTSVDEAFLQKAIGIITSHISESEFGVETFAHEIFLSRTQLQRKLKAITNLAPSDFIRQLRLQRAKELLEKNTGTVAEIADQVGFNNHSYFSKCFQEQYGILPNQIRTQIK